MLSSLIFTFAKREGNVLIRLYLLVCMYVCMLPTFLKNYWTELHEIFTGMWWVGVRDVAVRPRRCLSLSYYGKWLRIGWLHPSPPPKGGEGEKRSPSAASSMSVPPPPPHCSPTGKGGEENTHVHFESSLLVSSPNIGPSEGRSGEGARGCRL